MLIKGYGLALATGAVMNTAGGMPYMAHGAAPPQPPQKVVIPRQALQFVAGADNKHLGQIQDDGVQVYIDPRSLIQHEPYVTILLTGPDPLVLRAMEKLSGCLMRYVPNRDPNYRQQTYQHRGALRRNAPPYPRNAMRRSPAPVRRPTASAPGQRRDNEEVIQLHASPLHSEDEGELADGRVVPSGCPP